MSISDNRPDDLAGHQTSEVELSRRAYRKRQQLKSVITSLISTIVLAAIIVVGLEMSPGWPRVKETFFSPEYFAASLPEVLAGLWLNVKVLVVALIIAPLVTLTRGMHWSMIVLAAALAGLIWWLGLSPVLILAAGAGAGIVWELSIAKKSKQ